MNFRAVISTTASDLDRARTNVGENDPDLNPTFQVGADGQLIVTVTLAAMGEAEAGKQAIRRVRSAIGRPDEVTLVRVEAAEPQPL
ncbi:MAG: hypothetical protein JWM05_809 [Acidimicrobiales bacterium]|nr:hypothetical protein [Acidimicrobiales bacterium]